MFCSQQWLADGKNAMLLPPELASSGQPISNGIGQPQDSGRPSRPISTLQEVTSEAEDEEREMTQDVTRVAMPHFLSPQPAPRQRSFSCTQHALNRRSSGNQPELSVATPAEKIANEHVEIVIVPHPREAASQSESKTTGNVLSAAQMDSERENMRNCNSKMSERVSNELPVIIQSSMWEKIKRKEIRQLENA